LSDAPSALTSSIKVAIRTIEEHFSAGHIFRLPWFQRAYAWSEEHATRLLRDIIEASQGQRGRYALGSVMLATPPKQQWAAVIDGHQRTLTLTILLALLRDAISDTATKDRLDALIYRHAAAGAKAGEESEAGVVRVVPQPCNIACFRTYIQQTGATLLDCEVPLHEFLESERNLLQNRNRLAELIAEHLPSEQAKLALTAFLLERCYLIVQIVEDEDEAWEMLSVEETTGLTFHASERSKVAMISVMRRDVQEEAGRTWDIWQARLGADGMTSLLHHMRTLSAHKNSSKPVEQDLVELYGLQDADLSFVHRVLAPLAEHYLAIWRTQVGSENSRAEISGYIQTMFWLQRNYWIPAVLSWLENRGAEHPDTVGFFHKLDRLSWLMRIAARDPVEHERRFRQIVSQIKSGAPLSNITSLEIETRIAQFACNNLLSRTFYDKSYARLVLRRLSLLAGRDCGPIDGDNATVEHVLPRRPPEGSPWLSLYPGRKAIAQHVHRLGNLVVLTFSENQNAGVRPLQDKQIIFAHSSHILARQVADIGEWTPALIEQRSLQLADQLFASWGLDLTQHN